MKLNRIFQFSGCMTILVMVVGGAGLVGNVIAVIVLSRWSHNSITTSLIMSIGNFSPEMNNCFNQIVIAMNIMDR